MKQTPAFHISVVAPVSGLPVANTFEESLETFENKEYLVSFHQLLYFIDPELRSRHGNEEGTEFHIPHGSIVIHIRIENEHLTIDAPFLSVPEKGRVPLLRQIAGLNLNMLDLAQIVLNADKLHFEYRCPVSLMHPGKIYAVFQEICRTGDRYDDEFAAKFGAQRIYEPRIVPYSAALTDTVYEVVQNSCDDCLRAVEYFENGRKYGYAWHITAITLLKILYYARPQGQLANDLNKALEALDREDIPLPEIVSQGKSVIWDLKNRSKETLARDLYFVETFISDKRKANLSNIQENFEESFQNASAALEQGNYMDCCIFIIYQFYSLYRYNDVPMDIDGFVVKALETTSEKPWKEAAPVLFAAMRKIMEGDLETADENDTEHSADS